MPRRRRRPGVALAGAVLADGCARSAAGGSWLSYVACTFKSCEEEQAETQVLPEASVFGYPQEVGWWEAEQDAEAALLAASTQQEAAVATPQARSPGFLTLPGTAEDDSAEKEVLTDTPWQSTDAAAVACTSRFQAPVTPPNHATDLNGIRIPDVCLTDKPGPHHVFAIGDWGGVLGQDGSITPADHRSRLFKSHRQYVIGADNCAQQNVAKSMEYQAQYSLPDYVLNVGDNFYWGGYTTKCGAPAYQSNDASGQWKKVYEDMYQGLGLEGQWLGVLGNHDYGGWMFTMGWDQAISYTWGTQLPTSSGRWFTPAQYYSTKVNYPDFAVEYFFLDNNVFDAFKPEEEAHHNICSAQHNLQYGATCGATGPSSVEDCSEWFKRLWEAEQKWLEAGLAASTADWQVVVMHFPPEGSWGEDFFGRMSYDYGIDLIIAGHRHKQSFNYNDGPLGPTGIIVTGGGGGITSESVPDPAGVDDQYGFVDMALSKDEIMVQMISHMASIRSTTCITKRDRGQTAKAAFGGHSLCEGQEPRGPPAQVPPPGSTYYAPPAPDWAYENVEASAEPAPAPVWPPGPPPDAAYLDTAGPARLLHV